MGWLAQANNCRPVSKLVEHTFVVLATLSHTHLTLQVC